jgi:hypothetical protein
MFDLNQLSEFLNKTLSHTYAVGQGKVHNPQRLGFEEYVYEEGPWSYRDSYTGGAISWGQEHVTFQGQAAWSMVYGGGICENFRNDAALESEAFACMKEALKVSRSSKEDFLPRGPRCLVWKNYVYQADWQGDLSWFRGQEKVYRGHDLLHIYDFAGGVYLK